MDKRLALGIFLVGLGLGMTLQNLLLNFAR